MTHKISQMDSFCVSEASGTGANWEMEVELCHVIQTKTIWSHCL